MRLLVGLSLLHLTWAQFDLFSSQQTMEDISDQFGMSKALGAWGKIFRKIANRHDPKYSDPNKVREFTLSPTIPKDIDPSTLRKRKGEIINEKLLNIILPRIKGGDPFPTSTTFLTTHRPTPRPAATRRKPHKQPRQPRPRIPVDDDAELSLEDEEDENWNDYSEYAFDSDEDDDLMTTKPNKKPSKSSSTSATKTTTPMAASTEEPTTTSSSTQATMTTTTKKSVETRGTKPASEPQFTVVFHTRNEKTAEEAEKNNIESTILRMINETVKEKDKSSTIATISATTPSVTKPGISSSSSLTTSMSHDSIATTQPTPTVRIVTVSEELFNSTMKPTEKKSGGQIEQNETSDDHIDSIDVRIPAQPPIPMLDDKPDYIRKLEEIYLKESQQVEKLLAPKADDSGEKIEVSSAEVNEINPFKNKELEKQLKDEAKRLLHLLDVEKEHDQANYVAFEERLKEREEARNKINEFLQKMENINAILAAKAETKNKTTAEAVHSNTVRIITGDPVVEMPRTKSHAKSSTSTSIKTTTFASTTTTPKPNEEGADMRALKEKDSGSDEEIKMKPMTTSTSTVETTTTVKAKGTTEASKKNEKKSTLPEAEEEEDEEYDYSDSEANEDGDGESFISEKSNESGDDKEVAIHKKKTDKSDEEIKMHSVHDKKHRHDPTKLLQQDDQTDVSTTQSDTPNTTAPTTGSTVFNLNANANSESNPNVANVITPVVSILDGISPILLPLLTRPRTIASGSRTYSPQQALDGDRVPPMGGVAQSAPNYETKDPLDNGDPENSLIGFGTQIARELLSPGSLKRQRIEREKEISGYIEAYKAKQIEQSQNSIRQLNSMPTGAPLDIVTEMSAKERRQLEAQKRRQEAKRNKAKKLKEQRKETSGEKNYLPPYFVAPPAGYRGPLPPPPPTPDFIRNKKKTAVVTRTEDPNPVPISYNNQMTDGSFGSPNRRGPTSDYVTVDGASSPSANAPYYEPRLNEINQFEESVRHEIPKFNDKDIGYEQGRSSVKTTFAEDSGILLDRKPPAKIEMPPAEGFVHPSLEVIQQESQEEPPSFMAAGMSNGFGGGMRPSKSFEEVESDSNKGGFSYYETKRHRYH